MKGLATGSIRKWIRRQYGDAMYAQIVATLDHEHRDSLEQAWATSWVPATAVDALWAATVTEARLDDVAVDRDFRAMGAFVAGDNLSGVLSAVLTFFVNPVQLFGHIPKLWAMYFSGVDVRIQLASDGLGGQVWVSGLGDVRRVGVVVCGWTEKAFKDVGTKTLSVTERGYARGKLASDPLVFDMRWTT